MVTNRARGAVADVAWYVAAARTSGRFLLIVAAAVVLATALVASRAVVLPILFALVLAAALAPLARLLERFRLRRALASFVVIILLVVLAIGAIALTSRSIVAQWDQLGGTISAGFDEIEYRAQQWLDFTGRQTSDIRDAVGTAGAVLRKVAVNGLVTIVPAVVELVSGALLMIFVLSFFLRDGSKIWDRIMHMLPEQHGLLDGIGRRMWDALGRFTRGTTIVAAIDATGIGLGMWLIGVPFPGAIALLTFLLAYIPLLGATISGAFGVLLALGDGGMSKAIAALVIVLVVQQIEGNLLQPFIMGNAVRIHPLIVAFALVLGATFAGIVGMFLAVPLTAAAAAALSELRTAGVFSPRPAAD